MNNKILNHCIQTYKILITSLFYCLDTKNKSQNNKVTKSISTTIFDIRSIAIFKKKKRNWCDTMTIRYLTTTNGKGNEKKYHHYGITRALDNGNSYLYITASSQLYTTHMSRCDILEVKKEHKHKTINYSTQKCYRIFLNLDKLFTEPKRP